MIIKKFGIASILWYMCLCLQAQETQKKPADSLLFDFWVGTWEVSWDEGDGKKGTGQNVIEKTLDGKVIQENFAIDTGNGSGFKGTSISVYNPTTGTWHQAWADNQGGYYNFIGEVIGNKRVFKLAHPFKKDGKELTYRMVFYDINKDSLKWDWEYSTDGGETWELSWRIFYNRKS